MRAPRHGTALMRVRSSSMRHQRRRSPPIRQIGGMTGWYYGDFLWRLRGAINRVLGGAGLRRGSAQSGARSPGETIAFWRIEAFEADRRSSSQPKCGCPVVRGSSSRWCRSTAAAAPKFDRRQRSTLGASRAVYIGMPSIPCTGSCSRACSPRLLVERHRQNRVGAARVRRRADPLNSQHRFEWTCFLPYLGRRESPVPIHSSPNEAGAPGTLMTSFSQSTDPDLRPSRFPAGW